MLNHAALVAAIDAIAARLDDIVEPLNQADRQLGDGDTGNTVAAIVKAWKEASATLPADMGLALRALGRAAGRATGSSLGAVAAMGFNAAAGVATNTMEVGRDDGMRMLDAAVSTICERSGAAIGDKSVVDSLVLIAAALRADAAGYELLARARDAAAEAVTTFRAKPSKLGRARMYGERSVGLDDPGMLAVQLLLAAAVAG